MSTAPMPPGFFNGLLVRSSPTGVRRVTLIAFSKARNRPRCPCRRRRGMSLSLISRLRNRLALPCHLRPSPAPTRSSNKERPGRSDRRRAGHPRHGRHRHPRPQLDLVPPRPFPGVTIPTPRQSRFTWRRATHCRRKRVGARNRYSRPIRSHAACRSAERSRFAPALKTMPRDHAA